MDSQMTARITTQERTRHRTGARQFCPQRRGSILILVVGVLVLLMISATVYVRVGRLERTSSAAAEQQAITSDTNKKIIDYIGRILSQDLFGMNQDAVRPFEDYIDPTNPSLGYVGERLDIPYTRSGDYTRFSILSDPWLASLEPVDIGVGDERPDVWPHISNIHPAGKFVDLDKIFSEGFFGDLFIGGANSTPAQLDTFQTDIHVRAQMDDWDGLSNGYVTFADRRYGDDTDGDGLPDARWTEIQEAYGVPAGMRIFVAVRIIDNSGMLNVNANMENGLSQPNGPDSKVAFGYTPMDVDLHTFLMAGYGGPKYKGTLFASDGFAEHLHRFGLFGNLVEYGITSYSEFSRIDREDRDAMYADFGNRPYRSHPVLRPYGVASEIELRTFFATANDRASSRLELSFGKLNDYEADPVLISPLRDQESGELNYGENMPSLEPRKSSRKGYADWPGLFSYKLDTGEVVTGESRHLLTTYNGQNAVSAWNQPTGSHTLFGKPDLNELVINKDVQSLTGGFFWALAPYSLRRGGTDSDANENPIYGLVNAIWKPTGTYQLHYGNDDAGFAYLRSAQLAVNMLDTYDDDNEPTVRTLWWDVEDNLTDYDKDRDIVGNFDFGEIPTGSLTSTNGSGDQTGIKMTLIGLERQPFFREIATVTIYHDDVTDNEPIIAPDDWYGDYVAIEIGNPWEETISLENYEIEYSGETISLGGQSIPAGEALVIIAGSPAHNIPSQWKNVIDGRPLTGVNTTTVVLSNAIMSFKLDGNDEDTILWRKGVPYGSTTVNVVVDRIRPSDNTGDDEADFPTYEGFWDGSGFPKGGMYALKISDQNGERWSMHEAFVVVSSSMARYCAGPGGSPANSFPAYIFQSPDSIADDSDDGILASPDLWYAIYPDDGQDHFADLIQTVENDDNPGARKYLVERFRGDNGKEYNNALEYAPFQLLVQNIKGRTEHARFRSSVDPLMYTCVTHMNTDQNTPVDFTNPANYVTISEYLGDENLASRVEVVSLPGQMQGVIRATDGDNNRFDAPDFRVLEGNVPNPFVGRLDFTRYIPRRGVKALPQQAVPLAVRILDAFETVQGLDGAVSMVQGRINVQTAPRRVLQALPYLYPANQAGPIPPGRDSPDLRLADSIIAYRTRSQVSGSSGIDWTYPWEGSNIRTLSNANSGLRDDWMGAAGFTSLGELALLTEWRDLGTGLNSMTHQPPDPSDTDLRYQSLTIGGQDNSNELFKPFVPNEDTRSNTPDYDPVDDVNEWLSLVRTMAASASVRSDVFTVYVSVIGVTQQDVVRAAADANQYGTSKLEMLHSSMEQRFVVVFDRSNVKRPTDMPRLLFAAREVPLD